MTAKEAMRIIEQRHLTAPEAYEIVHALFEAEKDEADVDKLKMDAEHMQYERDEAREKLASAESLNVYFRDAIGECHLMISRKTSEYQVRKEWECTDLPPRLQTVMKRIAELELALGAETRGLLERAERAEAANVRLVEALEDFGIHDALCLLSQWHEGRPTATGGYETRYGDTWYQGDDKPPCTCGLGAALAEARKEKGGCDEC